MSALQTFSWLLLAVYLIGIPLVWREAKVVGFSRVQCFIAASLWPALVLWSAVFACLFEDIRE